MHLGIFEQPAKNDFFSNPLNTHASSSPLMGEGEGGGEEIEKKRVASAFTADESLPFTLPAHHPATLLTKRVLQVDIRRFEAKSVAWSGN